MTFETLVQETCPHFKRIRVTFEITFPKGWWKALVPVHTRVHTDHGCALGRRVNTGITGVYGDLGLPRPL